jgi:manganese efflux pump family protein
VIATAATVLALSFALAADAFAAAVCQGAIARPRPTLVRALVIGGAFGAAQGFMPLIGWAMGMAAVSLVREVDHWIAFALLAGVGAKMLWDARKSDDCNEAAPLLTGWALGAAALATSMDAAAAGLTLPAVGLPVVASALVIGLVTLATSATGVAVGAALGVRVGRAATVLAGLLLIGLGTKILLEHLSAAAAATA